MSGDIEVSDLQDSDFFLNLRQKGVDMRIGLDIATITLKKQASVIVLVSGDSDFVPAAKLARREGVTFILDPLWQNVSPDLHEHIDRLTSGFSRPRRHAHALGCGGLTLMPRGRAKQPKSVETFTYEEARRRNLPSAEHQPLMREEEQNPVRLSYERRNRDLDPQLVWRGKDEQDRSDLVVNAPPLYIQERIHPKILIDDLMNQSRNGRGADERQTDMFADFNGLPSEDAKTEFYQHDANWSNRMILGDSLHVMASLAEREGLRGKVQCIYIDPPYGIKFNSNFQWSTTSRDVRDGKAAHITREPEQVKAFRDTWRDGIHSYLTYLRDRLTVARDLLADSGSVFVQMGDQNVHRVRAVMDEVFGDDNFVAEIYFTKTTGLGTKGLPARCDIVLWFVTEQLRVQISSTIQEKNFGRYWCISVQLGIWSSRLEEKIRTKG